MEVGSKSSQDMPPGVELGDHGNASREAMSAGPEREKHLSQSLQSTECRFTSSSSKNSGNIRNL